MKSIDLPGIDRWTIDINYNRRNVYSSHFPNAGKIKIICDNARYYRAQIVKDFLTKSKIELVFLPPYAPNLNLIERFWKFFKKTMLYGKYYENFQIIGNS